MARLIAAILLASLLFAGCARGGAWNPLGTNVTPVALAGPRLSLPRAATHDALAFVGPDGHAVTLYTDTETWCFKPGENEHYLFGSAVLCQTPSAGSPLCQPATVP